MVHTERAFPKENSKLILVMPFMILRTSTAAAAVVPIKIVTPTYLVVDIISRALALAMKSNVLTDQGPFFKHPGLCPS